MKKIRSVFTVDRVLFAFSVLLLLSFFAAEVITRVQPDLNPLSPNPRTVFLMLVCLFFYLSTLFYAKRTGKTKVLKRALFLAFLLYLYLVLTFTLSDDSFFGRKSMELTREEYMETCVNFQPFHTVYHIYIKGYVNGYVSARYTLLNLQGNLIAFMPFAFFLPCFFPKQRHWYFFLPTILLTVCAVEGMQLLLMVGSCDVDDLILNVGGAFLLFWILKIPPLARFCTHLREGFPPREPKEKKTKEKRVKEKKPKEKKPRRTKADRGTV